MFPCSPEKRTGGAYGLTVTGDVAGLMDGLLVHPGAGWPEIELRWQAPLAQPPETGLGSSRAAVPLLAGHLVVERDTRTARFCLEGQPDRYRLAHPCLTAAASIFAWWDGRVALHAGGFVVDGTAWGLMGAKEAGKSTTMAWLAEAGHGVVADDLLVVEGTTALAGPRGIDLRPSAADRVAEGVDLVPVRKGERHRLLLDDLPAELPLGGFVVLEVGNDMSVTRIPPAERLGLLGEHVTVHRASAHPSAVLDLATLPMWRVRRSKHWSDLPELVDSLVTTVAG